MEDPKECDDPLTELLWDERKSFLLRLHLLSVLWPWLL